MTDHSPNIQAIIDVAREAGKLANTKPDVHAINGLQCLVAANGQITPLLLPEKLLEAPKRKRAAVSFYETASFIEYVKRHSLGAQTHVFGTATEEGGGFTAILDFHEEKSGKAAWGEHVAKLELAVRPEWARWVAANGRFMGQTEFAEFIDENMADIVEPDGATVLEWAQGLQGVKNVQFKSGRNLKDGAIKLEYVETIEVQGTANRRDASLQVPDQIRLQLVPFVGAQGVEIKARIRFRITNGGGVSFAFVLDRPYKVIEEAFELARQEVEAAISTKVLLGSGRITNPS